MDNSIEIILFKDDCVVQSIRCKSDCLTLRNIKILFTEYIKENELMVFVENGKGLSIVDLEKQTQKILNGKLKSLELNIINKKKYNPILNNMLFVMNTINWIKEWERNSHMKKMKLLSP